MYALHQCLVGPCLSKFIELLEQGYYKAGLKPASTHWISTALLVAQGANLFFVELYIQDKINDFPLCDFCVISTQFQSTCFLRGHHYHRLKMADEATVTDTP